MHDQRRHQRIRFGKPLAIRIGFNGQLGSGYLENLSISGFMVRTEIPLEVGKNFGCEFSIFGSARIDTIAITVSCLGDLFGARFQAGPISSLLVKDALDQALASGHASSVSMHTMEGKKVLCVAGGLNASLENDFSFCLTKSGIHELDLSGVTRIDPAGLALCRNAMRHHGVSIRASSECFASAWQNQALNASVLPHPPLRAAAQESA
ncbi:MAG: PilZ domain protein [Betaproteobacteria bacterium ADurb.Bin341]|nr:MAG: PilZ domain protein [Betaproteobacteria bacterium ADurb.Bin341]